MPQVTFQLLPSLWYISQTHTCSEGRRQLVCIVEIGTEPPPRREPNLRSFVVPHNVSWLSHALRAADVGVGLSDWPGGVDGAC